MVNVHVVQFQFSSTASEDDVKAICDHIFSLKDKCIHPETKKPYIISSMGGKNHSWEGLDQGITHAFVMQFENQDDLRYYLEKDEAHLAFVASIKGLVEKAIVVDFTPGKL